MGIEHYIHICWTICNHQLYRYIQKVKKQKDKKKCKNTKREKHAKRATKYKILLSRQLLVLRTC